MFRELHNECRIEFDLSTESPLLIKSSDNNELDPTLPDNQFIRTHKNGELVVVMPGSSIKGVFRNRAEKLLKGSCDIFRNACGHEARKGRGGKERYEKSCPACKLFGSIALKSRILFKDAYPVGNVVMGKRTNVGIDRITGSSRGGALFSPEVIEEATFHCEVKMENIFKWQLKVIVDILDDINEGLVVFGGNTSRGFGRMKVSNVNAIMRYYDKKDLPGYQKSGFYVQRAFTIEELKDSLKDIEFEESEFKKVEYDETL